MADTPLLKKLLIKPGQRIIVLDPPDNLMSKLGDLPEGVNLDAAPDGEYDTVILFVREVAGLLQMKPVILKVTKYDGLLWICYPKGSSKLKSDLSRDTLREKMADTNWRPVTLISVDETWSAMRFRPTEAVGT